VVPGQSLEGHHRRVEGVGRSCRRLEQRKIERLSRTGTKAEQYQRCQTRKISAEEGGGGQWYQKQQKCQGDRGRKLAGG